MISPSKLEDMAMKPDLRKQFNQLAVQTICIAGLLGISGLANAYSTVPWSADLTTSGGGTQVGSGWGNSYNYLGAGDVTAQVTAWYEDDLSTFQTSAVSLKAGGSGSCNEPENGNVNNCLGGDNHARLDNKSQRDFLLIHFDPVAAGTKITYDSLSVFTPKNNEYELTFWVGNLTSSSQLLNAGTDPVSSLGFTYGGLLEYTPATNSKVDHLETHLAFTALEGNALLLGFAPASGVTSEVYINAVATTVPVPAPLMLLLSGLGLLSVFRKKA